MIGTFVNAGLIIAGSLLGGLVKKVIKEEYSKGLFTAMGLAALGLGINAVVQNMPDSKYPVLFIASLALGSLIGTILKLDDRIGKLSAGKAGDARLGQGIITGALLFCAGTLSILGPVQSALYQDHTFLFTNATLDFVTATVLASTYGIGIMVTAAILFCWQGSIFGLTLLLGDFITEPMMTELSIVGGILIVSSGLSILELKDCKTLNMLPALAVPVIWCLIVG
ncbi:MAG: DUF554 domain-containing protein [Anaerovoracaceae bacterium]|nr:DUF554 domain-containing protein [Anaerovoracaceae bacterium]